MANKQTHNLLLYIADSEWAVFNVPSNTV